MRVGDIAIVTASNLPAWVGARVKVVEILEEWSDWDYGVVHEGGPWPALHKNPVWFADRELAQVSPLQLLAECAEEGNHGDR